MTATIDAAALAVRLEAAQVVGGQPVQEIERAFACQGEPADVGPVQQPGARVEGLALSQNGRIVPAHRRRARLLIGRQDRAIRHEPLDAKSSSKT